MKSLFFFDDWLLRAREGLDRKQGQPRRVKESVPAYYPELRCRGLLNPDYDELQGCYATYVDCHQRKDDKRFIIRLETDDPYNLPVPRWTSGSGPIWTRMENVVMDQYNNPLSCFNVLPLLDTPLAKKGYFMNLYRYKKKNHSESAAIAFSQDGLHFEVDEETSWIPHFSDTGNPTVYNPWSGQYMIFCRPEFVDRRVAQVITTDLKTFSPATVILQPDIDDPVCREFYSLGVSLYDDVFMGMLEVYDTEPEEKAHPKIQGTNETYLAYSYNGQNWYRAFRQQAFFSRTEAGTSLGGCVCASVPVRAPDNRLLFGVMGNIVDHGVDFLENCPEEWKTYKSYLYDMRLDGFVYLKTRARYGLLQTKTVIPQGGELTVNIRTTPSGYVKVAVLDEKTLKPLTNYTLEDAIPITGDELFGKVHWRKRENLDELKDRPVILEVHVREGELYALRFSYWVALGEQPHERL